MSEVHAVEQLPPIRFRSGGEVRELFAGLYNCTCGWLPVGGGPEAPGAHLNVATLYFADADSQQRAVELHAAVFDRRNDVSS